MAPTPYTANSRMVFSVTISGFTHELHYACNSEETAPGSGVYLVNNNDTLVADVDPQDIADNWWTDVRDFWNNTVSASGWVLEQYFSGLWVTRESGAFGSPLGTGNAPILASIITTTFKDSANRKVNVYIPEASFSVPLRYVATSGSNPVNSLVDSVLDTLDPASIGYWMRSRGDNIITSSRFSTGTVSKKFRKLRNLL